MAIDLEKGSVSIDAENIMPVIKRWLYSDKDIFLREVVSNGCDAITKYKMLGLGADEAMKVQVTVDKENREIRIDDTGIGMTADEVRKYINQVAFSSASEFLKQFADRKEEDKEGKSDIIGHFGLGFYSVFMVSERVEIQSLSYQEGAESVHWESTDGMNFAISQGNRTEHGTTIILHISEEEKDFLEMYKVREILSRYCGYMAYPVMLFDANAKPWEHEVPDGDEKDENGKQKMKKVTEEPKPEQINDTDPLWLRKPSDCKDDEYKAFYHKMFTDFNEPLFWIHLNVDYPFNLKGILYFPKLREDFGVREGEIKLFSGQVFVADNIKEIIPEFLMLLRGVIDCPDIPLNVSRSFLQNDGYVKKISSHITKKVADKLTSLFNTERESYEKYWDDIGPFVKYGCIRDNKFYDMVKDVLLFKLTDGKYKTIAEYKTDNADKTAIKPENAGEGENGQQGESGAKTTYKCYYTSDPKRQAGSISLYTERGIDVTVTSIPDLDAAFMNFLEFSGNTELQFARVDADVSGLTEESEEGKELDGEKLQDMFRKALDQKDLKVTLAAMANADLIALVTEDEQMRRMREVYRMKDMPDSYSLVLNRTNATVQALEKKDPEDEMTKMLCQQVYDLARMAAKPLENEQITDFLARSQKMLGMLVGA